jgi:hypothetical protein
MWKTGLFFITIVLVTPAGRSAVSEFTDQISNWIVLQAPYSYVSLVIIAISVLACLLLMRGRSAEKPAIYLVRREVRLEFGYRPYGTAAKLSPPKAKS